ncbi:hypothetical protein K438DRAFT_1865181 [Mycena galopus ATCC 62051]|nr:hypothetical protein K438DRAFT_1865181 [Mycena galopus ATCC 62051]
MYNKHYLVHGPKETAYILSRVPSSATTTLVVATNSLLHVCLSHPRSSPPIRWKSPHWPLGSFRLSPAMIFPVVIFGIPLFFAYLVTGVMTLAVLSMWIYQRVSKPPWPKDERTIEGPGQLEFDDWMRIQSLPEEQLTLVTLADTHCWPKFILRPTPGLTDSAYSAVVASLDLGRHMQWLTVEPKTNLAYADLVALVNRHPHLIHLRIEPDSIRPFSLPRLPIVAAPENNVRVLTAPPPYIPYVLPAVPNVHSISLLFTSLPKPARWMSNLRSATFDLRAYRAALEAIASLPGAHPLTLDFTFPLTAASLPWDVLPSNDNTALLPETRLTRVSNIWFHRDGSARFRASDIRSAVRWLGLFPSLRGMGFAPGAVEKIPVAERAALAEAICVACRISGPQNITFNING